MLSLGSMQDIISKRGVFMKRNANVKESNTFYGLNIYRDKKGRTIYSHPLIKPAVYVAPYDMRYFQIYRLRFIIAIATYIVLQAIIADFYELSPLIPLALTFVIFLAIEFKFISFVKRMQPAKGFNKQACESYWDVIGRQDTSKLLAKIVLYFLLGVLVVVNAYQKQYDGFVFLFSWAILVVCVGYSFLQIYALFKAKK